MVASLHASTLAVLASTALAATDVVYEHDLARPEDDAALAAFMSRTAAAARAFQAQVLPLAPARSIAPAVVYTYTNIAYEAAFDNWLHCVAASLATPVVAAMDKATLAAFARRNVTAVLLLDSASKPLGQRSLYIKAELSRRLLSAGLKLIFSEMDIFWINDPHLIEDPSVDLQVSEQGFGKEDLNLGFFLAQPSEASVALFSRLSRWPHASGYVHCWDQAFFDFAVSGEGTVECPYGHTHAHASCRAVP